MEEKIQSIETKISVLNDEINNLSKHIVAGFTKVENNFEIIRKELNQLNSKNDSIGSAVDEIKNSLQSLEGATNEGFGTVEFKLETLTDEISKIGAVTNYDQHYSNLKIII